MTIANRVRGIIVGAGVILLFIGLVSLWADWRFSLGVLAVAVVFLAPFWLPWMWRHAFWWLPWANNHPRLFAALLGAMWTAVILVFLFSGHPIAALVTTAAGLAVACAGVWLVVIEEKKEFEQPPRYKDPGASQ